MTLSHIFVLALVQGFTEFLPISSSAHLILVPVLSHWPDQGLAFDVAVHVGTLIAIVSYFYKDLQQMLVAWLASIFRREHSTQSRLAWAVLFATIPVGIGGLLLNDLVDSVLRSPLVIAGTTIGFGLLLGFADWYGKRQQELSQLNWRHVVLIGLSQVLALIPGTSRSGITMTTGLMMGLTRQAAARFSFYLSIPTIVMAGGYKALGLLEQPAFDWTPILWGVLLSALSAYLCVFLFLKLLDRMGMLPFVLYRLVLGAVLLYLFV